LPTGGGSPSAPAPGPGLLSADETTARIAAAGALLSESDAQWSSFRDTARRADDATRLPRSIWVEDPGSWQPAAVADQVDTMATAPNLQATHDVVIRTVRLSPPALPPPPGTPQGVTVISPASQLGVTVVVADDGVADEPRVATMVTLTDQTTGLAVTRRVTSALTSGGSVTLPTAQFTAHPGSQDTLAVQIVLPPGQTSTIGTAPPQTVLRVAPAT
jgi:hypothetical protein